MCKTHSIKKDRKGVPIVAQWLMNPTRNHEVLGLLSGVRIRRCHKLWCRSQTQLGSYVAVAVAQAGGSSDQTPSPKTTICLGSSPRKEKKKKTGKIVLRRHHKEQRLGAGRCGWAVALSRLFSNEGSDGKFSRSRIQAMLPGYSWEDKGKSTL